MRFLIPPPDGFTHRARLYGFPCWFRDGPEGCDLCGTNLVADWCVLHVAPVLHRVTEGLRYLACPYLYEPNGWPIEIRGPIQR